MVAVFVYEEALKKAADNDSRASIHKNLSITYELLCRLDGLEGELRLFYLGQLIKHANKAI